MCPCSQREIKTCHEIVKISFWPKRGLKMNVEKSTFFRKPGCREFAYLRFLNVSCGTNRGVDSSIPLFSPMNTKCGILNTWKSFFFEVCWRYETSVFHHTEYTPTFTPLKKLNFSLASKTPLWTLCYPRPLRIQDWLWEVWRGLR